MLIPDTPEEEKPKGGYIEFLNNGPVRGCSCSAGCLQILILLLLIGVLLYLLFFR